MPTVQAAIGSEACVREPVDEDLGRRAGRGGQAGDVAQRHEVVGRGDGEPVVRVPVERRDLGGLLQQHLAHPLVEAPRPVGPGVARGAAHGGPVVDDVAAADHQDAVLPERRQRGIQREVRPGRPVASADRWTTGTSASGEACRSTDPDRPRPRHRPAERPPAAGQRIRAAASSSRTCLSAAGRRGQEVHSGSGGSR